MLKIVIATFSNPDRAPRALASLAPGLDGGIGMAAIVSRTDDGKIRFVETTTAQPAKERCTAEVSGPSAD